MTPMPTIRQLQFFISLARRKSFSRAAEECLVSQSTLSAAIKELETILDAGLVDRSTRTFALTPLGIDLLARAEHIIGLTEEMVRKADTSSPLTGELRLGIIPTIGPFLLPRAMPLFEKEYPDLSLFLREDLTANLLEWLRAGRIDMALIAFPYEAESIETITVGTDNFWFAAHDKHPLAQQKKINVKDLKDCDLLLLEDGHCLRDHALSACQLQQPAQRRAFGGTSLFTLTQMARSGLGATLLPDMAVKANLASSAMLKTIPFDTSKGTQTPMREIGIAWRRGSGLRIEAEALGEIFRDAMET